MTANGESKDVTKKQQEELSAENIIMKNVAVCVSFLPRRRLQLVSCDKAKIQRIERRVLPVWGCAGMETNQATKTRSILNYEDAAGFQVRKR